MEGIAIQAEHDNSTRLKRGKIFQAKDFQANLIE